jgi:signal transduction histidine kinase
MILLVFQTGRLEGLAWFSVYIGMHAVNFAYLSIRWDAPTALDVHIGSALFVTLMAAFIWLPGQLLLDDNVSLRLAGVAAIVGNFLWLLKRSDISPYLLAGELAVVAIGMGILILHVLPDLQSLLEKAAVIIAAISLMGYLKLTMSLARNRRLNADAAARRAVEAQRLEALGRLTTGVSHDFQNILTAANGNLELYNEVATLQEKDRCVREALMATRQAHAVLGRILSYGAARKRDEGPISVTDLLENVNILIRQLLPRDTDLILNAPLSDIEVGVPAEDLTTSLLNLAANARDAMPKGGQIILSVRSQTIDRPRMMLDGRPIAPGRYARFDMRDQGTGIARNIMPYVLDPFFSTKDGDKGAGLGLPLAADFARNGGGGLTISSSADGTCVSLFIPIYETIAEPAVFKTAV